MAKFMIPFSLCFALAFVPEANGTELIGDVPENVASELREVFEEGVQASVGAGYARRLEPKDNRYLQSIENDGGEFILTYGQSGQWSERYFVLKRCSLETSQCRWEVQSIKMMRR